MSLKLLRYLACSTLLLLFAAPSRAAEPEGPLVVGVELQLPPGTDPSLLGASEAQSLVAVRKGQRLSIQAVRRSIERLFATGRFSDVVVRAHDAEGGVNVVFELAPKRLIAALTVVGNQVLSDEAVLQAARLQEGAEYFEEKLELAVDAVREAYRRKGYLNARTEVSLRELPEGLDVELEVQEGEPTRIVGLTVSGSPGLPLHRLIGALGLEVGDVLDLDAAEVGLDRLRAVYRHERFFRAKVFEPVVHPGVGGAVLAFPVSAGPQYEVHLHGNHSFPDELLEAVIGYDGSETLDAAVVSRLERRLAVFYRFRGFHDVRVRSREVQSPNELKAVLAFDIDEGRPLFVREVVFSGNERLSSGELRNILTDTVRAKEPVPEGTGGLHDDPLELEGRMMDQRHARSPEPEPSTVYVESAYQEAARAMTDAYRERGFLQAKVSLDWVQIDVEGERASVGFRIVEGPQALVRAVSLEGVEVVVTSWGQTPDAALRVVGHSRELAVPAVVKAPGPLTEAHALANRLEQAGASVELRPELDASEVAEVKVDQPLSYAAVERSRNALLRSLARKGYLFARVDSSTKVSPDGREATVAFELAPGPQVRVGEVLLKGLERTNEEVVLRALEVKKGEPIDPEKLFETQRNLVLLGVFRTAQVRLSSPERVEPVKDVEIEVKEMPRLSGETGMGYFLAEGPRWVLDLSYPNAFGQAVNISFRLKASYVGASAQVVSGLVDVSDLELYEQLGGRANLSAYNRGLLSPDVATRIDVIAERVHKPNFRFTRGALVPGAEWSKTLDWALVKWARPKVSFGAQLELEGDSVAAVGGVGHVLPSLGADEERLRFPVGTFWLGSVRGGPTLDLRDDPANPHRGVLLSLLGEYTQDFFTRDFSERHVPIRTLKGSGTLTFYFPVAREWVLALSGRYGQIIPLQHDSVTIPPKRFFLGGGTSMRGFREDGLLPADRREVFRAERLSCEALANPSGCTPAASILRSGRELPSEGGELFMLGKAELRFPVFGAFDLGVFFEAGNLWLDRTKHDVRQLRYVAGTGLRYVTPIGPLVLDLGWNLMPDPTVNEPTFQLHFNIGLF